MIIKTRQILRHHRTGLILLVIGGLLIIFRSVALFYTSITLNNFEKSPAPPPTLLYGIPVDSLEVETDRMKPGQTLAGLMAGKGLSPHLIDSLIRQTADILPPQKIKAGQQYTFMYSGDSLRKPLYFIYENNPVSYTIFYLDGKLRAERIDKEISVETGYLRAPIESSLWKALSKSDNGPELALALENVFGWSVDFFGLQKGDEFMALYE